MRINLPDGIVAFAQEFSRYKTPVRRTQGFAEQAGQARGRGDVLDTIGSLMFWRYLVENGVPATYLLTALQGDDADIVAKSGPSVVSINVNTSEWQKAGRDTPCDVCHLAVKEVEFSKLPTLFAQVMVHLEPAGEDVPHVHLCGWIETRSEVFQHQKRATIPNTGGARGLWIPSRDLQPVTALVSVLK